VGALGLDTVRLTEGRVLRDLGVTLIIIAGGRGNHRVALPPPPPRKIIDATERYTVNMKLGQHRSQFWRLQEEENTGFPEGNVNILVGPSIGHSKQKTVYAHVSYSERFPRQTYFTE
jgi:hypothetical protein